MKVYRDRNDWWIGYYRGSDHHYVCPLPTLVIRWRRKHPRRAMVFRAKVEPTRPLVAGDLWVNPSAEPGKTVQMWGPDGWESLS